MKVSITSPGRPSPEPGKPGATVTAPGVCGGPGSQATASVLVWSTGELDLPWFQPWSVGWGCSEAGLGAFLGQGGGPQPGAIAQRAPGLRPWVLRGCLASQSTERGLICQSGGLAGLGHWRPALWAGLRGCRAHRPLETVGDVTMPCSLLLPLPSARPLVSAAATLGRKVPGEAPAPRWDLGGGLCR